MRDCIKERKLRFLNPCLALFIAFFCVANAFAHDKARDDKAFNPMSQAPLPDQSDPLQGFNRAVFTFNDKIDCFIVKPIAMLYNKIIPRPLNQGIHNFFSNLNLLPTIANDILQLQLYQTLHDAWRFGVNTTIGIGGLFDVATLIGLEQNTNDFGLTLARYGWKNSTYLVLPFFGPCTIRDTVEIPVDYYYFTIYPRIYPPARRYQLYALGIVDRRAQLLQFESVMDEAALDKYVFVRNAYLQRRCFQIAQNTNCVGQQTQGPSVKPVFMEIQESAKPVSEGIGIIQCNLVALSMKETNPDVMFASSVVGTGSQSAALKSKRAGAQNSPLATKVESTNPKTQSISSNDQSGKSEVSG